MVHVKDLSSDQKVLIESILGRALHEYESLTIRASNVIKDAPNGPERALRFKEYIASLDRIADRLKNVPEDEIDTAIDEATDRVRHYPR